VADYTHGKVWEEVEAAHPFLHKTVRCVRGLLRAAAALDLVPAGCSCWWRSRIS
jgi:hypothetical protein